MKYGNYVEIHLKTQAIASINEKKHQTENKLIGIKKINLATYYRLCNISIKNQNE